MSNPVYANCQSILPATSIGLSITCHFYNLEEVNLVAAGANRLHIYRINRTDGETKDQADRVRLEQIQSFDLFGIITSLDKINLGNRRMLRRDALVLTFNDAKLSIVEYNPQTHDLKTISMHFFEDESLRNGRVTNHMAPPIARVDPEDRCIAMLVYGKHIVVVPLSKDEDEDLEDELYDTSPSSSPGSSSSISYGDDEDPAMDVDDIKPPPNAVGQVVTLKRAPNSINKTSASLLNSSNADESDHFKNPVLPTYIIDLSKEVCGEVIENIVDIQFLHNYNDSTLVILHEPSRTWSGRVAMRQDTFSMVALSMNVHQRLQPIIWTVNNLPYDCLRVLPVPKPIGGLLIIACNEIIYLNQSVPAFGMSFNSFTKDSSSFPLCDQEENNHTDANNVDNKSNNNVNISFDLSQSVFLDYNKILFILENGDVYLVTLFNDDMRSIKKFHFEHIASTVQPDCLTLCSQNLLFIGSHVGDSVLAEIVGDFKDLKQIDDLYNDMVEDGIDVISNENERKPVRLVEHDQLMSTSSCGKICYGEASNISENLPNDHRDPHVELVLASGYHKNGAICVLQRSIKPNVEDTYELKDCNDLWTLKSGRHGDQTKSRLLLNRQLETIAFSTHGELLELKQTDCAFETSEPTILAANLGEENLTLQVLPSGARLILDDKLIDDVRFESKVCDACLADPHIIALTSDNSIYHLQLQLSTDELTSIDKIRRYSLTCGDVGALMRAQVVSMSLYEDISGIFTCQSNAARQPVKEPTYWLLIVDNRGVMEIFRLPDFMPVYSIDNFPSAPTILSDNVKMFIRDLDSTLAKTKEILMCGLGPNKNRPMLFVRSESELVIYEAFSFNEFELDNHLKVRFRKVTTLLLTTISGDGQLALELRPQKQPLAITQGNRNHRSRQRQSNLPNLRERFLKNKHWLHPFPNINGYSGVFLKGFRPHWILMTDFGALRCHPMNIDGPVFAFSPFTGDNFIYFTEKRELRIANLSTHMNLDFHWPIKKIQLDETVHFVNYHVERKIYCVVTSSPKACSKIMKVGSEPDSMKTEMLREDSGYIPPTTERFRLRLYDPEKWEQIPDCEIEFEEWEQVTCVKNVMLASEGTTSGLKGYIAISTNYCYGEDVPNRGRIWILDLIEVVPEPDRPLTKNKIKKVYCQEQKGPVTTLTHTCGLLLSAVGQKIYLWQLKEEQLDGVAFIDTQIYIHCAASVKNLILVSDVCKSISLLRYQQETRTLSMICRDTRPLEVFACDFIVDNESLNFVVTDSEKNLIICSHNPEHAESLGGTRLLRRADYHLGAHVTSLCRLRGKVPSALADDPAESIYSRRKHLTLYCTVDGSVGFLYPISESVYRQFQTLQNEMNVSLAHVAGLNPKAWRLLKQARPSIANPCKQIVDGDLISRYLILSSKERSDLAKKIGSTSERILADIQAIQEASMYF